MTKPKRHRTKTAKLAHSVLYLTGAPAAGKSTLGKFMRSHFKPLLYLEYGQMLTDHINRKKQCVRNQHELRTKSAKVVTPMDISRVDNALIPLVQKWRGKSNIIIDSHPVTKEEYGFRITGFSRKLLRRLAPSKLVMLYTEPTIALNRIKKSPDGRPTVSKFESAFHTQTQASVLTSYALELGIPAYFIDSNSPTQKLADELTYHMPTLKKKK